MKIILLTEFFPSDIGDSFTGGVEARVYYLSKYLSSKKNIIKVVSRTDKYSSNTIKTLLDRAVYFIEQLAKIAVGKIEKADIVEGTNFTTYILAYLWARKSRAAAVAWWPDVWGVKAIDYSGRINGLIIYFTEKIALNLKWDGVIALSKETKRKLIKAGLGEKNIKVIYGGVKFSKFPKFPKTTLICISRLVSYKRVGDLILAVYLLKQRFPDIRLLIIGSGPEESSLKLKVRNLKLGDSINLLGKVSEDRKLKLLSHSHLHILPSTAEGFGLVTAEALSTGTPVVNADIPVNQEVLEGEKGGLLFVAGDYVDLTEKIEMLLTDKKLYNQKAKEGKELIKKYDWEKVNRETEEFYQRLLSN